MLLFCLKSQTMSNNIKGWRYKFCKPSLLWPLFHHIKQPNALVYDETLFNTHNRLNYFEGFWQSELYFSNAVNDVRRSFRFKSNIFNKEALSISKQIGSCNSVSIHIRRGDYLNFPDCKDNPCLQLRDFVKI